MPASDCWIDLETRGFWVELKQAMKIGSYAIIVSVHHSGQVKVPKKAKDLPKKAYVYSLVVVFNKIKIFVTRFF